MKKIALLALLIVGSNAIAQTGAKWSLSIGGSLPLGDFAAFSYNPNTLTTSGGLFDAGAAMGATANGFNLGGEALFPLQGKRLSFSVSADIHYNSLVGEAKSYINSVASYSDNLFSNQLASGNGISILSVCTVERTPAYFNIPILAGLRYTAPAIGSVVFFAEGGVGFNLRLITPLRFTERASWRTSRYACRQECEFDVDLRYALRGTLAFRLGAGIRFAERLSLGAYYYYMGAGDVAATMVTTGGLSPVPEERLQLGNVDPMVAVVKLSYQL